MPSLKSKSEAGRKQKTGRTARYHKQEAKPTNVLAAAMFAAVSREIIWLAAVLAAAAGAQIFLF